MLDPFYKWTLSRLYSDHAHSKLDFEVSDFFMFGCPLALVLVYRKMVNTSDKNCEYLLVIDDLEVVLIHNEFILDIKLSNVCYVKFAY